MLPLSLVANSKTHIYLFCNKLKVHLRQLFMFYSPKQAEMYDITSISSLVANTGSHSVFTLDTNRVCILQHNVADLPPNSYLKTWAAHKTLWPGGITKASRRHASSRITNYSANWWKQVLLITLALLLAFYWSPTFFCDLPLNPSTSANNRATILIIAHSVKTIGQWWLDYQ